MMRTINYRLAITKHALAKTHFTIHLLFFNYIKNTGIVLGQQGDS